jgi:pimeloyl-ACP methyl ester carboxylesterase
MDAGKKLAHAREVGVKTGVVLQRRLKHAQEGFTHRAQEALAGEATTPAGWMAAVDPTNCYAYAVDSMQRAILFWDTIRQRGNNFVENAVQGLKPVLHFEYETVLDGRSFARPVNYALLKITPPAGVTVDNRRRPYVIIDPRAGHGPGIGGFKDDSQVGVALRAGHPVYFVIFFRDPEPGQTLLDVCEAEQQFIKKVRALHPDSQKPAIIGNCQGGWAAMMLAASDPDDTGPIVINGAPMSYWGGAWSEGEGDNPMRYSGGLLGGTWLSSLTADLGNGKFDGAWLVQNFENLNPANSLWDKYYNLYRKADTEPPRFLEFEHWWGGYYLMNREEIEWITRNLFVGNKLWSGDVKNAGGKAFDLRDIKAPIVLFASMGDNITPPQQAFNWVVDVYGSTEEIKARGQVIVGMMHENVGHLGIFVSGKVAQKEHAQIVSVLQSIELLPPGLYGMVINEHKSGGGVEYEVEFREHSLEEIAQRLNRFERADERPFEAVAALSEFNQRAYELFAQPFVQAMSNETTARMLREFHPLRMQNWAFSDMNPWMAWLGPAAKAVTANRQALDADNPLRQREQAGAEMLSAGLDAYRAVRDAMTEATFFNVYANMLSFLPQDKLSHAGAPVVTEPRELPEVKAALAAIEQGGYAEALARVACLLKRQGEPLPLSRLELRKELVTDYADMLPELQPESWRRIRGQQEIITLYAPEQALETLPVLLRDKADRERVHALAEKLRVDERVLGSAPTTEQLAMFERIRSVLSAKPDRPRRAAVPLARAS